MSPKNSDPGATPLIVRAFAEQLLPSIDRRTKKERSGLQSACDELIDKGAIHHR
jgi:hypothetical protein